MDPDTYLRYIKYGYKLSRGSLSRLSYLRSEYFTDLVELMRRHGRGIEQEVIDPISWTVKDIDSFHHKASRNELGLNI